MHSAAAVTRRCADATSLLTEPNHLSESQLACARPEAFQAQAACINNCRTTAQHKKTSPIRPSKPEASQDLTRKSPELSHQPTKNLQALHQTRCKADGVEGTPQQHTQPQGRTTMNKTTTEQRADQTTQAQMTKDEHLATITGGLQFVVNPLRLILIGSLPGHNNNSRSSSRFSRGN